MPEATARNEALQLAEPPCIKTKLDGQRRMARETHHPRASAACDICDDSGAETGKNSDAATWRATAGQRLANGGTPAPSPHAIHAHANALSTCRQPVRPEQAPGRCVDQHTAAGGRGGNRRIDAGVDWPEAAISSGRRCSFASHRGTTSD